MPTSYPLILLAETPSVRAPKAKSLDFLECLMDCQRRLQLRIQVGFVFHELMIMPNQ